MKVVRKADPVQAKLFDQYWEYPELRGTGIKMAEDEKGNVIEMQIRPKAYFAAKERLKF